MKKYLGFTLTLSLLFIGTNVFAATSIGTNISTGGTLLTSGHTSFGSLREIDPSTGYDAQLCSLSPAYATYGNGCPGAAVTFSTGASVLEAFTDPLVTRVGLMTQSYTNLSSDSPNGDVGLLIGNYLKGPHTPDYLYGIDQYIQYNGTGTTTNVYGQALNFEGLSGGITNAYGYSIFPYFSGAHVTDQFYGFYLNAPDMADTSTITNAYGTWIGDLSGISTGNSYAFWYDSPGVYRIKADGVMAYYNPTFTKYTPGATNYERVVQQWSSDVAQYGTENQGTGAPRALAFMTASTTRMTIGANGNVGIGVTSPTVALQVATSTSNATTSLEVGKVSQTKGSCLVLYDAGGNPVYAFVGVGATTFTLSSVSCK